MVSRNDSPTMSTSVSPPLPVEEKCVRVAIRLGQTRERAEREVALAKTASNFSEHYRRLAGLHRAATTRIIRNTEKQEREQLAEKANLRYVQERELFEASRRAQRKALSMGARYDVAMSRAKGHSTVSAQQLDGDRISGSKTKSKPPSLKGDMPSGETAYDYYSRRMKRFLEALEREVDAVELRPMGSVRPQESGDEKDKRLVESFEGWPAHEVSVFDRTMGSPRTVERARARLGLKPKDGLPEMSV